MKYTTNTKQRLLLIFSVLIATCAFLLGSCLGTKNLVTKHSNTFKYDYFGDPINGWSLVRQDSLWGYVSEDGKQVVKPVFPWADCFTDGMALVQYKNSFTFINTDGKLLRRIKAKHAYPFSEGLAPVEIRDKWAFINPKGKKIVKRQFDWAQPFCENRAAVSIGFKKGYINKKGQVIIAAIYDEANAFKNGVALVQKDRKYGLIDTLGNNLLPTSFYKIEQWEHDFYRLGILNLKTGFVDKYGLADAKGRLLLDTIYAAIDMLDNKYIRTKKDTLVGLFDRTGKVVIPMDYTFLGFISDEGFIAAQKNEQWGFLNTEGEEVHSFEYEGGKMGFSEGRSWVNKDSTYLLMDNHLNAIKKFPEYNKVFYFSNGLAIVGKKDTSSYYGGDIFGFVDKNGNEVIPPKYHAAWPFNPYGTTVVGIHKEGLTKEYIINTRGKLLSEEKYYFSLQSFGDQLLYNPYGVFLSSKTGEPLNEFPYEKMYPVEYGDRKDLAKAYRDGKVGLIDTTLTELLPPEFDDIGTYSNGRMALKKGAHWGYTDEQFRIRIPFVYDKADYFRYQLTEVEKNKLKGAIDRTGRIIIPLTYSKLTFDNVSKRFYAEKEKGVDIYDNEGRLFLASDYEYVGGYWSHNSSTFRKNGKTGIMDFYFQVLCEPRFDRIGRFHDGLAWVVNGNRGGFINEQYQIVIPIELEDLEDFAAGFTKVKKESREFYINTKGEEFIPTKTQLKEREQEKKRRRGGFIDFSS